MSWARRAVFTISRHYDFGGRSQDCDTAISLDPTFVKAWSRKGTLHFLLKEYPKALEAFDKGLAIDPNSKECIDGKIQVMRKVQQQQQSGEVDEEQMRHAMVCPSPVADLNLQLLPARRTAISAGAAVKSDRVRIFC